MQKKYRHIIVAFLTFILLVPTVGVNALTIYCLCKHELKVSFLPQFNDCKTAESDCCKASDEAKISQLKPCCQKLERAKQQLSTKHDCTKKSVKYIKGNLLFTGFEYSKVLDFQWINIENQVGFIPNFYFTSTTFAPYVLSNKAPSPPLSGRYRLAWIQTYRC